MTSAGSKRRVASEKNGTVFKQAKGASRTKKKKHKKWETRYKGGRSELDRPRPVKLWGKREAGLRIQKKSIPKGKGKPVDDYKKTKKRFNGEPGRKTPKMRSRGKEKTSGVKDSPETKNTGMGTQKKGRKKGGRNRQDMN